MFIILPPSPRSTIFPSTAWLIRNVPRTLTPRTFSNASSGISRVGAPHVAPELLTRMSTAPKELTVSSTTAFTCSGSVTSQAMASALPPRCSIPCLTSSQVSFLREQSTTLAPASTSASAMYCPSPLPPPVTMAALPSRRNRSSAPVRAFSRMCTRLLSRSFRGLHYRGALSLPKILKDLVPIAKATLRAARAGKCPGVDDNRSHAFPEGRKALIFGLALLPPSVDLLDNRGDLEVAEDHVPVHLRKVSPAAFCIAIHELFSRHKPGGVGHRRHNPLQALRVARLDPVGE